MSAAPRHMKRKVTYAAGQEKEENGGARHHLTIQMPKTAVAKARGRKIDITAK